MAEHIVWKCLSHAGPACTVISLPHLCHPCHAARNEVRKVGPVNRKSMYPTGRVCVLACLTVQLLLTTGHAGRPAQIVTTRRYPGGTTCMLSYTTRCDTRNVAGRVSSSRVLGRQISAPDVPPCSWFWLLLRPASTSVWYWRTTRIKIMRKTARSARGVQAHIVDSSRAARAREANSCPEEHDERDGGFLKEEGDLCAGRARWRTSEACHHR
jgi:hypothetical protein